MAQTMDSSKTRQLVEQASQGDRLAWEQLITEHGSRLRRMVALRLDRRLRGRIDPSDVLQEAYVDAARRLNTYADKPTMPFFLWLRFLVGQRLLEQHRRHLGRKARDVGREVPLRRNRFPETTAADLAEQLLHGSSTPSRAAIRAEQRQKLHDALDSLDAIDREILALRHFEQLSNGEAAEVLALDKSATSKRYARALIRLKEILREMPGGFEELPS